VTSSDTRRRTSRIAIIGAGPGGLCMASRLKAAGQDDIVLLEKGEGVGGTWYHNTYPGCACDVPSGLYSFSFELKRDWSRPYAPQPEIRRYFEDFAKKYDLLRHCRFGAEVSSAHWDEERARWKLTLASGEHIEADILISALGMFNDIAWPDIPGHGDFAGTAFHSARWQQDHDVSGETIGVIGSAASAVQMVPELVKTAKQVHLFQRTPNWVLPKLDDPFTDEQLAQFRSDPSIASSLREIIFQGIDQGMTFSDPSAVAESESAAVASMEVVIDSEVRAKLRPTHPFGCKRPLFSNDYYPAFNAPNLELVTDGIERISEDAIVTVDGRAREIDTLIYATGFAATKYLSAIDVVGRDGRRISDAWDDGASAYLGITTSGFPNLFMIYGPNTNNGSIITMIESQVDYILRKIEWMHADGLAWIDVRPEPMERYNEDVQAAIEAVEVWQAGCNGYYRTPSGRVVTQWPYSMSEYRRKTTADEPQVFEVAPI
jgi:cation diffusion facilitator CzcD-associated flavoprotein CzcO